MKEKEKMLIKITRTTNNNWLETFWLDVTSIKSMTRLEYKPGKFNSLQVYFWHEREPMLFGMSDEKLAQKIIDVFEQSGEHEPEPNQKPT